MELLNFIPYSYSRDTTPQNCNASDFNDFHHFILTRETERKIGKKQNMEDAE